MKVSFKRDWFSAALVFLMGSGVIYKGLGYGMGSISDMEPGYFPVLLGSCLLLIGLILIAHKPDVAQEVDFGLYLRRRARPWLCIVGGIVAFIVAGEYGGFVPATFLSIFISAFGDRKNTLKDAALLAASVTVVSVALFHYAMRLQFPLFVWG